MVLFARRVAHVVRVDAVDEEGVRRYRVHGQLFFASSNDLVYHFDYAGDPDQVIIDLSEADVWDASTVAALDAVQGKYAAQGKQTRIEGLRGPGAARMDRLSGTLGGLG
jgi:SulP family sulfate permease